jgi:hypothetical protein
MTMEEQFETRLSNSLQWVDSSKRQFSYLKDKIRHSLNKHPQGAVEDLVTCIEKLSKAIAIATGIKWEDVEDYSHKSLKLYADILKKLLDIPLSQTFANTVQGSITQNPEEGIFLSYQDAIDSLQNVKQKIYIGRDKVLSDWAYEWATLSKDKIQVLVDSQMKQYKVFKRTGFVMHLIPIKFYLRHNVDSKFIANNILTGMEFSGFNKSDKLRDFLKSDEIKTRLDSVTEEQKMEVFKNSGLFLVTSWMVGVLWIFSALTSPHGMSFRYPGKIGVTGIQHRILTEADYNSSLGIVSSLKEISKVLDKIMKEIDKCMPIIVSMFINLTEEPNKL